MVIVPLLFGPWPQSWRSKRLPPRIGARDREMQRTLFETHQGRPVTTLDTVWDYALRVYFWTLSAHMYAAQCWTSINIFC
jgi:hypothetical protein